MRWTWLLLCCVGCSVDPLTADVCGNHIVEDESGEDCDSGPRPEHVGQSVTCAAAGETNACRYVCSRSTTPSGCPAGWSCGTDGVCRHASGEFTLAGTAIANGDLHLGDIDGDGKLDLLAASVDQVQPLFNNGSGNFTPGRIVPAVAPFPLPEIGDLDGDGRVDVLTGTVNGFIQVQGTRTRAMAPVAYPTATMPPTGARRVVPLRLAPPTLDPASPNEHLFVIEEEGGALQIRVLDQLERDAAGNLLDEIAPVALGPGTLADVAGVPPRADLLNNGAEEIVVVTAGATSVTMFTPVTSDKRSVTALTIKKIALPAAADARGARFADVDGDGKLDLMVSLAGEHVAVARGLGGGSFAVAAISPFFDALVPFGDPAYPSSAYPLGAISLGAGKRGWINNYGVFRDDAGQPTLVDYNNTFNWTEVVVGDFNHDGLPDIAGAAGKPTLDVFLQTSNHLFAHTRVPTALVPTNLRVGDFDGDGTDDLAFRQSTFADVAPYELSIAFGGPQGLQLPSPVGQWSEVTSLERSSIYLSASDFRDGIDDLVVHGVTGAGATESLTFLVGSYQRVMLAPYDVVDPSGALPFVEHAVIGRFDADGERDVATIVDADPDATTFTVAFARGRGKGDLEAPVTPLGSMATPGVFGFGCSAFQAADVDGDGRDDVVGLFVGGGFCSTTASQLVVGRADGAGGMAFAQQDVADAQRIALANVDRDPAPEVLVSAVDANGTGVSAVLFREPDGAFTRVLVPIADARGVAALNADADPEPELVVVTSTAIVVFDIEGRSFVRPHVAVSGYFGDVVFAADIDGDQIDDLIVQDAFTGEVHVFVAAPHDRKVP